MNITEPEASEDPVVGTTELASIFLRLGITAFGGPAAHIAMMRTEFVDRRQWISEADFLDLVGASNLLPGPSSTETAIFLGQRLAGSRGLALAGVCFILPAALIVTALAWAYVTYGSLPQAEGVLYGVKPVIIAVVAQALLGLGKTALKSGMTATVALLSLVCAVLGIPPIAIFVAAGSVVGGQQWLKDRNSIRAAIDLNIVGSLLLMFSVPVALLFAHPATGSIRISSIFLAFAKIGSMIFGSGYVLLAFLRDELVHQLHWLTLRELIDAVAIGQFTPGPVFTTATFIGFLLKGPAGAAAATVGIFLPAFLFVAFGGNLVTRIRSSAMSSAFFDGVNAAAVAVMAAVTYQLAIAAVVDLSTIVIAGLSLFILLKYKINSAWLVAAGGVVGMVLHGSV